MSHRCPDDSTLAALFENRLPPAEREALYGEMSACADCQETLVLVGMALADEQAAHRFPGEAWGMAQVPAALEDRVRALYAAPAEPPVWQIAVRRVRGVIEALADSLAPAPMPALAVRGHGEEPAGARDALRFEVDVGVPVELLLTEGGIGGVRVGIRPLQTPASGSRVVLSRGGAVQASLALDLDGVHLPELEPGRYAVRFEVPGRAAVTLPLDLRG